MHILGAQLQTAFAVPHSTAHLQASLFIPDCTMLKAPRGIV